MNSKNIHDLNFFPQYHKNSQEFESCSPNEEGKGKKTKIKIKKIKK